MGGLAKIRPGKGGILTALYKVKYYVAKYNVSYYVFILRPMPLLDTDRLLTFDAYAKQFPKQRGGGVGVTVSYIHQLMRKGKLPEGVKHHIISGVHFVELPEKPSPS